MVVVIVKFISRILIEKLFKEINYELDNKEKQRYEKTVSVYLIYFFLFMILSIFLVIFDEYRRGIIISLIAIIILRLINGGNHFKSPDVCLLVTSFVILINPFLINIIYNNMILIFIYCFFVYLIYAPYTYKSKNTYILKKIISLILCVFSVLSFNGIFLSAMFILSFDIMFNKNGIRRKFGNEQLD